MARTMTDESTTAPPVGTIVVESVRSCRITVGMAGTRGGETSMENAPVALAEDAAAAS